MPNRLGGRTAIVGIGATEFSKDSGRSEMSLACESVLAAITDAGLSPSEVDGMVSYTADNNPEIEIARHVGIGDTMAKPRLQLTAKLRDALLSETDDWHSLTARQSSEILDDLLTMMAKAAKADDAATLQRVGSTAGVLIDRI